MVNHPPPNNWIGLIYDKLHRKQPEKWQTLVKE